MDYLEKIKQTERETPKTTTDWLTAWRELAHLTYGLTTDDPRFEPVMRWLNVCDVAFSLDSWSSFQEAAGQVTRIIGTIDESRRP